MAYSENTGGNNARPQWSHAEVQILQAMFAEGHKARLIAEKVGRTEMAVMAKALHLRLFFSQQEATNEETDVTIPDYNPAISLPYVSILADHKTDKYVMVRQ